MRTVVWPSSIDTPGSVNLKLSQGTYMVYERTGRKRGGGGITFTENGSTSLRPEAVRVTSPSGNAVPTTF
ncbi:MAG: hypothetical protein QOD92_3953, partial [Acidimicrobiaceae bacterium]